jgi:hypothetical protein
MPEQMTKQDAIEYLLYMKHDVQAKSPMDIALDTAIEALKQPTIEAEPVRHGRWIVGGQEIYCSECNGESLYNAFGASKFSDFCPRCGARMDGENER